MNPVFLLAALIGDQGNIELPIVRNGRVFAVGCLEVGLGDEGELLQRLRRPGVPGGTAGRSEAESLDLPFFAECLAHVLGPLTPPLFGLAPSTGSQRFETAGAEPDRERQRLLLDAFNVHLMAYEERLV